MCITKGQLVNDVIKDNNNNFSLEGMLSPTFQNEGDSPVLINGRSLAKGESYVIDQPGIVLTGTIAITFDPDKTKSRILYVGYVRLVD